MPGKALAARRAWYGCLQASFETTLLEILAGKHMIPREKARVLGLPAFDDPSLANRVSLLAGNMSYDIDVGVDEILAHSHAHSAQRTQTLLDILGVDPAWRRRHPAGSCARGHLGLDGRGRLELVGSVPLAKRVRSIRLRSSLGSAARS